MKSFSLTLSEARQHRHLSQQKLAEKAGLSLATVQNIEAGTGNPALSTIQALLSALSLEIELRPQKIDFEILAQLGVPLMVSQASASIRFHRSYLLAQLSSLASSLETIDLESREASALAAFFCALCDHYPSVWTGVDKSIKLWLKSYPREVSPKLRRLSIQRLANYL